MKESPGDIKNKTMVMHYKTTKFLTPEHFVICNLNFNRSYNLF